MRKAAEAITQTDLAATAVDLSRSSVPAAAPPFLPRPRTLGRRYVLLEWLGQGGMGEVYRALDRLNGRSVALKRVTADNGGRYTRSRRRALTTEFRHLASLSHPHIVRVFDFAFDEHGEPYFTMELLESAREILEAGVGSETARVQLLVQLLQALEYLHRQGFVHRDVKPSNVVVENGRVKLLDFGISFSRHGSRGVSSSGSLPYLAPETLAGEAPSAVTDLFGVGLIAYELFAGRHPFASRTPAVLFHRIVHQPADLAALAAGEGIRAVVGRLLAKDPAERYRRAGDVIRDLRSAAGLPSGPEPPELCESLLRNARHTGRHAELETLAEAVERTAGGRGGTLLLAGESGIGRSRLAEELRVRALLHGRLSVLRGRARRDAGDPYGPWRAVLRELVLVGEPSDFEAAVLAELVGDVAVLLGRDVEPAPKLGPRLAAERRQGVVESLFSRLDGAVVLLEDLQWAPRESLKLLARLARLASRQPLLIVGTVNDEIVNDLPRRIRALDAGRGVFVTTLGLRPLSREDIAELAAAMLGERPAAPLLGFLERYSGGNPGRIVEVMRALARYAGGLDRIAGAPAVRTPPPGTPAAETFARLWSRPAARLAA